MAYFLDDTPQAPKKHSSYSALRHVICIVRHATHYQANMGVSASEFGRDEQLNRMQRIPLHSTALSRGLGEHDGDTSGRVYRPDHNIPPEHGDGDYGILARTSAGGINSGRRRGDDNNDCWGSHHRNHHVCETAIVPEEVLTVDRNRAAANIVGGMGTGLTGELPTIGAVAR